MMKEEQTSRSESDFVALSNNVDQQQQRPIPFHNNQLWRERVAQWFYDVLDYLDESRDAAYVAMNTLDRYVAVLSRDNPSVASSVQPFDFEVMAFTSLFLAIRVCGSNNTDLQVPGLLRLSRSGAQPRHVLAAGNDMLQKLSWNNRIVTPHSFLKVLHELLLQEWNTSQGSTTLSEEQANDLLDLASYLVEVSVCDSYFCNVPPTQVASAALTLAVLSNSTNGALQEFLPRFFEGLRQDISFVLDSVQMKAVISKLHGVYQQSHEGASAAEDNFPEQVPVDRGDDETGGSCPNIIFDQEVPSNNEILLNVLERRYHPEQPMRAVSPTSIVEVFGGQTMHLV
jgi:hypothetical protein